MAATKSAGGFRQRSSVTLHDAIVDAHPVADSNIGGGVLRDVLICPVVHADGEFVRIADDANRDPISGAPGSHSVGTGLGAAIEGIAAGALAGTVVGPVGTVVGAVIGTVVGGLAGKGSEAIDPTAEEAYWRENYANRSYVSRDASFDDYGPAYRYGVDSYGRAEGRTFDQAEPDLKQNWERAKGSSRLPWENAKHASRDSWQRISDSVERAVPGDSDQDGK